MKVQFEGEILIGNHGAVDIRNWTCKADDGETDKDFIIGMKKLVIARLHLALEALERDLAKLEAEDVEALRRATTGITKH